MYRLICLAVGYACGLFNTAMVLGRARGFDIREHGSGNAGMTNMLRTKGPLAGVIVLLGDLLKAVIPALILTAIFRESHPNEVVLIRAYTGLGAILGHDYPFFTHFRGGKGIATGAGVMFALDWRIAAVGMTGFVLLFALTHYVSFCSLAMTAAAFLAVAVFALTSGFVGGEPVLETSRAELCVIMGLIIFLAFFRHRGNIKKLMNGTERKTYFFKKNDVE